MIRRAVVCFSLCPVLHTRLFPSLAGFLEQFQWAKDRYHLYALKGPSQAAKTSFMKSLFKNPFVLTIQGHDVLDLRGFEYGTHDALIIDNLVTWDLILKHRAMLQSNADIHLLGAVFHRHVLVSGLPVGRPSLRNFGLRCELPPLL